ncbi:MAG: hypothetical protein ABIG45_07980, partial [Bacillota bacterium]
LVHLHALDSGLNIRQRVSPPRLHKIAKCIVACRMAKRKRYLKKMAGKMAGDVGFAVERIVHVKGRKGRMGICRPASG